MIRHAFKLIWNRKRRSVLLMGEILLSFVVLFVVASALITGLTRYLEPLGFSYESRWLLDINRGTGILDETGQDMEARAMLERIREEMLARPEITSVSFISSNHPYSRSTWSTGLHCRGKQYGPWIWLADDVYATAAELRVLEGRWFQSDDDVSPQDPIVLTRALKEEMFGDESPLGEILADEDGTHERIIVGVVENYRYKGEFEEHKGGFFERHVVSDTAAQIPSTALFTVQDGSDARAEEAILKDLSAMAPNWTLRIKTLEDSRRSYIQNNLLGAGVFVAVAGFLILNVALGLFGVLWQSVSRRHGEIGLRRAVGASKSNISAQVLLESLVLATIAIGAGVIVAVQVPILGLDTVLMANGASIPMNTYLLAMVCGALLIYLLVSLCALYPSQLAARVQPAAALHDD